MTSKKKRKPKGKIKGNKKENQIAPILSNWMCENESILQKEHTSGAKKEIWTGDIIPIGPMPSHWNNNWIFHIEVKHGYKDHLPTFFNYKILEEWMEKCYDEAVMYNQFIILLIAKFHYKRKDLVITNHYINYLPFNLCFQSTLKNFDNLKVYNYVYYLQDLMDHHFHNIFPEALWETKT